LELLGDLLERARDDEAHPIPVLFHLSSWGRKWLPLTEWLVGELTTKYQVPEKLAQSWVGNDQVVLLLDGLDEVDAKERSACIEVINTYRKAHGLVPVVICCRSEAYRLQASRLLLQTAVVVQPLSPEQIDASLARSGEQLEGLRQALEEDRQLQQMITTPLMLNIVAVAYQGESRSIFATVGSLEVRRQQVLARYVKRMLARSSGRVAHSRYSPQQIQRSLTWLARQLARHHQAEYHVERMQPDWLPGRQLRQRYRASVIRLLYGIQIIINAALFSWLRGGSRGSVFGVGFGLLGELGAGPGNTILGWMAPGLGGGLGGGGSLGIIIAIISVLVVLLVRHPLPQLSWWSAWRGLSSGLKNGGIIAVLLGGFSGLVFYLSGWSDSLSRGIGVGLFSGLLTGLVAGLLAGLGDEPKFPVRRSLRRTSVPSRLRRVGPLLVDVLIFSLCAGFSFGIVNAVIIGEINETVVLYAPIVGLFYGVVNAIAVEMHLLGDLDVGIHPAETVLWSWHRVRQDLRESVRKGIQVALWVMVGVGASLGCASALFYGLSYGVRYGAIYGLIIGCVTGVAGVLSSILTSGWSSETLEAHEFGRPNEGIRRSGRNAAFAASLFGPIGGLVSGLVCGGAFGLLGGLPGWPVLGGGLALVLGFIFALVFATIHGGTAWIEHYVLRWYLWRAGYLPWRAIRLLDEAADRILLRKVGGGYMFIHALLLDYFASLSLSGNETGETERVMEGHARARK
jgi:hypothetical protein